MSKYNKVYEIDLGIFGTIKAEARVLNFISLALEEGSELDLHQIEKAEIISETIYNALEAENFYTK